jgi:phosphatidate cytidylyltransferase
MLLRIISALVLIPLVVALVVYAGPHLLLAALVVLGTLCLLEYSQLVRAMGLRPRPWLDTACLWGLLITLHWEWLPAPPLLAGIFMLLALSALRAQGDLKERAQGMMASFFGVLYIGLALFCGLRIRFEFGAKAGLEWLVLLLAVTWAGDSAAMLVGRAWGKTPFAPRISPKKTNEGALAGLAGGLAAGLLLQLVLLEDLPRLHVAIASLLIGAFGQAGDLAESLLKRAAGTKDSSHLIPGHGGVLDRVDSLLFAMPVLYIYLLLLRQ